MHIDDFVDDRSQDPYARWMFLHFRLPAILQILAREFIATKLFCTYEGDRYRVTGASRLGDVWLTTDFEKSQGYDDRVDVADCSDWSDAP